MKIVIFLIFCTTLALCMDEDLEIDEEEFDLDNKPDDELKYSPRNKRWFGSLFKRCKTESDCGRNYCCAFNKRCAPKLFKYFTCHLTNTHKCGCREGLVCKQTSEITIPIVNKKFAIRQCVDAEEP